MIGQIWQNKLTFTSTKVNSSLRPAFQNVVKIPDEEHHDPSVNRFRIIKKHDDKIKEVIDTPSFMTIT